MSHATVLVDRPGKKVTLFLSAYESVTWTVNTTPGTELAEVILGGNRPQLLDDSAAGVKVTKRFRGTGVALQGTFGLPPSPDVLSGERLVAERPEPTDLFLPNLDRKAFIQQETDYRFTHTAQQLRQATGLPFTLFLTPGAIKSAKPIVVRPPDSWVVADPAIELHGASIYRGYYRDGVRGPAAKHAMSYADVTLDRPGKKVILFLSAHDPVTWDVTLSEGTMLEGIVLGGYYDQRVAERICQIRRLEVTNSTEQQRTTVDGTYGATPSADVLAGQRNVDSPAKHALDGEPIIPQANQEFEQSQTDYRFTRTARTLREITGLPLASFTAQHEAEKDAPIVLGTCP